MCSISRNPNNIKGSNRNTSGSVYLFRNRSNPYR